MSQNQAALQGKSLLSSLQQSYLFCCTNSNYCNVGSASITTELSGMLNILHPNQNCLAWLKIFVLASLCKLQHCCQVNRSHLHCHLRHRWQSIMGVDISGLLQPIEPCSIFCDRLRSCDHMETTVLRSAIEMYPIIFLILTDDSTLISHNKPECSIIATLICFKRGWHWT